VQFAVLEFENVFDLGRKLFAYRLTDFSTGGGRRLILDVDPVQLGQARGFSEDSWPRWSDAYWASYQPEPGGRPLPGMAVESPAAAGGTARTATLMRARELIGKQVRHRNGSPAGEIEDLVVDLRNGAITHAIIDIEGTVQQARVPIDVLAVDADAGQLTLGMDPEQRH
jgi:sporulation protein YlmC with PRC-barrel domain